MVLLTVMTAGIVGLPILAPRTPKTGRFPCENCLCGCPTAEFCWDKCCCHTDVEKLQWAAEQGVVPPAFLIARMEDSGHSKAMSWNSIARAPSPASCCEAHRTCDRASVADAVTDADEPGTDPDAASSIRLVQLEDAAKCRGISRVWTLLACGVVNLTPVQLADIDPPLLYCLVIQNDLVVSRTLCPDPPIP